MTDKRGLPYIRNPFLELQDQECIKMCADIVFALSKYIRPYSVDFPLFKNLPVTGQQFKRLFNTAEWVIDDISTANQTAEGITVLTFSPTELMEDTIDGSLGACFSTIALSKVRIYISSDGNNYRFSVLPVVVLKPIYEKNLEKLFDHFADHKSLEFRKNFVSSFSKIHFIQYVTAGVVALHWHHSYATVFGSKVTMIPDRFNDSLLFNPFVSDLVFNSVQFHFSNKEGGKLFRQLHSNLENMMAEDNDNLVMQPDTPVGIQSALVEPFVKLYNEEELKARKLVYDYQKDVFSMQEYKSILGRLKRGFSVNYLKNIIDAFTLFEDHPLHAGFDRMKFLSLFLDKSIDLGIVVPIVAEKKVGDKTFFYRAYRHGEDVIFGEMEFMLCTFLLNAFIKSQQRADKAVTRLVAEKLIVLFLKIGLQKNVFVQFISNLPGLNAITTTGVVSIRNYLLGQVATFKDYDKFMKEETPVYVMSDESKSNWITRKLLQKGMLTKTEPRGFYTVGKVDFTPLDQNKKNETLIIGDLFGELMRKGRTDMLDDGDLVTLTSCIEPNDIAGSLAAEVVIFNAEWDDYRSFFEINSRNPLNYFIVANGIRSRKHKFFTAINSGQDKFIHYLNQDGFRLIKEVDETLEKQKPRDAATWRTFWSPNISRAEEDSAIEAHITAMGLWLLKVNLLFRIMEYCLRKIATITPLLLEKEDPAVFIDILKSYEDGTRYDYSTKQKMLESITDVNQNDLNGCLEEIAEYRAKCLRIQPDLVFTSDSYELATVKMEQASTNALRTMLVITKANLESLYAESVLLINDTDTIVNAYGKAGLRSDYGQVVYMASLAYGHKKKEMMRQANELMKRIDGKYAGARNGATDFAYMILDGEKLQSQHGLYIFIGGSNSETIAFEVAYELYKTFAGNLVDYLFIFRSLKQEYMISRAGNNSGDVQYRYFPDLARFFAEHFFRAHGDAVISIISDKLNEATDKNAFNSVLRKGGEKELKFSRARTLFSEKPFPNEVRILGYNKQILQQKKTSPRQKNKRMKGQPLFRMVNHCDIGIITIKATESNVLLGNLDNVDGDVRGRSLKKVYAATLPGKDTSHDIIVMQATEMGTGDIKDMFRIIVDDFKPKLIIVFGTAGGYEDKVSIGDVLVVKKIIDYESGKEKPGGFLHETRIYNVNTNFRDHYIQPFFTTSGGDEIEMAAAAGAPNATFMIKEGVVGCGNRIIEDPDGETRAWIREVDRKANGFEMESLGAYASDHFREIFYKEKTLGVVAVRAITDYGDPDKTSPATEKFRKPGLENGMIFLKKFIATLPDLNKVCASLLGPDPE